MNVIDVFVPKTPMDLAVLGSDYWQARNEYLKLVNDYATLYQNLEKGKAFARAWLDELFPEGIQAYSWFDILWGIRLHIEHPVHCDCNGFNNPLGCAECRVSARVEFQPN